MFAKLVSAVFLTALAGRALAADAPPSAFNVTIGKALFFPNQTLLFPFNEGIIAGCNSLCQASKTELEACAGTDFTCLCQNTTVSDLAKCEQCMFEALIDANKPAPDVRAGSNQVLAGWNANCNLTGTAAVALTTPASWDGPFVAVFPTAVGSIIAATGGILGISLIYMLSNM